MRKGNSFNTFGYSYANGEEEMPPSAPVLGAVVRAGVLGQDHTEALRSSEGLLLPSCPLALTQCGLPVLSGSVREAPARRGLW